ncbi:MAG: hypothetical protein CSA68_11620 [Rhodobacterales bacterium]|nr:MAG: hypothetical protein CSA68_11620 [Rhodobacterales bacterium]
MDSSCDARPRDIRPGVVRDNADTDAFLGPVGNHAVEFSARLIVRRLERGQDQVMQVGRFQGIIQVGCGVDVFAQESGAMRRFQDAESVHCVVLSKVVGGLEKQVMPVTWCKRPADGPLLHNKEHKGNAEAALPEFKVFCRFMRDAWAALSVAGHDGTGTWSERGRARC